MAFHPVDGARLSQLDQPSATHNAEVEFHKHFLKSDVQNSDHTKVHIAEAAIAIFFDTYASARKVEISFEGVLHQITFHPPVGFAVEHFPKPVIMRDLIQVNGLYLDKVLSILKAFDYVEHRMARREWLSQSLWTRFLINRRLTEISDFLVLVLTTLLNLVMVVFWKGGHEDDHEPLSRMPHSFPFDSSPGEAFGVTGATNSTDTGDHLSYPLFGVLGTLQLILWGMIVVRHVMRMGVTVDKWQLLYKCVMCTVSLAAFVLVTVFEVQSGAFLYGLHLMHVTESNFFKKQLQPIKYSLYSGGGDLVITIVLLFIFMYILSLVAFAYFRVYFNKEAGLYCDTLVQCVLSSSTFGLRFGGGLGEMLTPEEDFDSMWLWRYAFDMLFYWIIAVFGLNFVLGIIVDSFSEHRAEKADRTTTLASFCFVCGLPAGKFARTTPTGFEKHVHDDHYILDYLALMKYVKNKSMNRCSHLERAIKSGWVDAVDGQKDISLFPFNEALAIKDEIDDAKQEASRIKRTELRLDEIERNVALILQQLTAPAPANPWGVATRREQTQL